MKANFKFWLEEEEKFYGAGPHALLKSIDQHGSLKEGATNMGISYSKALKIIQRAEKHLGFSLLERTIGGRRGGGSRIMPRAREWMRQYDALNHHVESTVKNAWTDFNQNQLEQGLVAPIKSRLLKGRSLLVSVIGGGGKTSTLNYLWHAFYKQYNVLYTSTTKVETPDFIDVYFKEAPTNRSVACFESEIKEGKSKGLEKERVDWLKAKGVYDLILCEADGSKNMPFKAYASHEPPVPKTSDIVIILIGCDTFTLPAKEGVHRYKKMDLAPEKPIKYKRLIEYVKTHYFDKIPPSAKVFILFNKYDSFSLPISLDEVHSSLLNTGKEMTVLTTEIKKQACYHVIEV